MRLVLGPYDLISPAAAASLSLMLASDEGGVVTLVPAPLESDSPEAIRAAANAHPRYVQLLEAWRWTAPLWRASLLRADADGVTPLDDIRAVCTRLAADPQAHSLRKIAHADLFSDPDAYLDLLARDLLRGGGDPSVLIPLLSGLERFAARQRLPLVRQASDSLTARLDRRSGVPLARFTIPLPIGRTANGILHARRLLSRPLESLRVALAPIIAGRSTDIEPLAAILNQQSAHFASAFQEASRDILDEAAHAGEPMRLAEVAVTVSLTPVGASFEAAARAVGPLPVLTKAEADSKGKTRQSSTIEQSSDVPSAPLSHPRVIVLTAKQAPWDIARQ